ncbi:MAG: PPOX class F420-dependent oxidoreductase [Dehalococcoidia bacterium]|nr:PPOX class F420-dependent oxidoreductase [Dehalococcoidia bacterium]
MSLQSETRAVALGCSGGGARAKERLAVDIEQLRRLSTVVLTTYRRYGTPVGTPVNVAVDDGRAYMRTFHGAGKARRIQNNPVIEVAPATYAGRPTGPAVRARAHRVDGTEADRAARAMRAGFVCCTASSSR